MQLNLGNIIVISQLNSGPSAFIHCNFKTACASTGQSSGHHFARFSLSLGSDSFGLSDAAEIIQDSSLKIFIFLDS